MPTAFRRLGTRLNKIFGNAIDTLLGLLAAGLLKTIRLTDPHRMGDFAGRFMQWLGPWLPEHRVGRANLIAAFPDKSQAEIDRILAGVWDNLGRLAAEFAHLDRIWDHDPSRPDQGHIDFSRASVERFIKLRDDGKPALVFAAHLGNWEMPALPGAAHGLPSAVLYRTPSMSGVAKSIERIRAVNMGLLIPTGLGAPIKVADALTRGLHVGMLVDQYNVQGVDVMFFGRSTKANPMLARLARHFECPIHGTRVVRLPNRRFYAELTEEIPARRDKKGQIDIQATMQAITDVVEGWIREYPEQWLWVHRRWR